MKTLITLFICLQTLVVFSQNLVPNGSFEDFSSCPAFLDNIEDCNDWMNFSGTCDYYNACSQPQTLGIPQNVFGYQNALSGNGYIGLSNFEIGSDYREYAAAHLITPLEIGIKYFISFYVSRGYKSETSFSLASNNIGIRFSAGGYSTENPLLPTNVAAIFDSSVLVDTSYWHQVKGEFVADSAYEFVILGNFFNNLQTQIDQEFPFQTISYLFIEDVRVSTDSVYAWEALSTNELGNKNGVFPQTVFADYLLISNPFGQSGSLHVFDAMGRFIINESIRKSERSKEMFMGSNGSGLYLLIFQNEERNFQTTYKIIKQ